MRECSFSHSLLGSQVERHREDSEMERQRLAEEQRRHAEMTAREQQELAARRNAFEVVFFLISSQRAHLFARLLFLLICLCY